MIGEINLLPILYACVSLFFVVFLWSGRQIFSQLIRITATLNKIEREVSLKIAGIDTRIKILEYWHEKDQDDE